MAAGQGGSCWLVVTGTANPLPESALSLYAFRPTRGALCNELPPFVQCLCRGMPMRLWHSRGFRRPLSRATPMARANWAPCTSRGGARNEGQFIFWTRKAAEQGHALAQANLGWAYEEDRGVGRDARLAAEWYGKAYLGLPGMAEAGHPAAQFRVGNMYLMGLGLPKDEKRGWRGSARQPRQAASRHRPNWAPCTPGEVA